MKHLNSIIEKTFRKHTGKSIEELNTSITRTLETRLDSATGTASYRKAKNYFQKRYFTEVLTICLGNISKASKVSGVERRHLHRLCKRLSIDAEAIRKDMIKPEQYLAENFLELIERNINIFSRKLSKEYLNEIYFKLPEISYDITREIDIDMPSYDEALSSFERNYFQEILKAVSFHVSEAAKLAGISERSVFRKIKELGIES